MTYEAHARLGTFAVWTNLAIFAGAAVVVWMAGTRLAQYADEISDRTKLSKAFLGLILLAVATSLPEIATTITAALLENAALVTGNLFGGVALQITVLAVVDLVALQRALTLTAAPQKEETSHLHSSSMHRETDGR